MLLSALVALSLTPALCAMLLRPRKSRAVPSDGCCTASTACSAAPRTATCHVSRWVIRLAPLAVLLLLGLYGATWRLVKTVPTSFLPQEDQGYLIVGLQLPDGSSLARTSSGHGRGRADHQRDSRRR